MDDKTNQIIVIVIDALKKVARVLGKDGDPKISLIFKILDVLFPAPMKAALGAAGGVGLTEEEREALDAAMEHLGEG